MYEPTVEDQAAEPLISVECRTVGEALVITVSGEIDMTTAPALRDAIGAGLHRPDGRQLIIDVTAVGLLASAGLAVLIEADSLAQQRNGQLRVVVGDNPVVRRPLNVTGLDKVLAIYPAVETAITGRPARAN